MTRLFSATVGVAAFLAALVVSGSPLAAEPVLDVAVDHARVLKIGRPAATIIIGNPAIVDVTVNDAETLVLTGRSFGLTNLVVLDAKGDAIIDERVAVTAEEDLTVRVYRQADRTTYACTPQCQPTLAVGDEGSAFTAAAGQFATREQLAGQANR